MSKKDTLVIIGNGFDIWQNLNTSYAQFQEYYLKHRDEILKKLHIKKKIVKRKDGSLFEISDVELIYGNPFHPADLEADFWYTFEASLGRLDAHRLNFFFGKEKKGLKMMAKSVVNANRILKEAFSSWISTISPDNTDSGFRFGDNCYFINFNYTDTLEKRFAVPETDITHIHGEAYDAKSIIIGHATHPQEPEEALYRFGGRFRGLFLIDYILYQTDKHVRDNITMLCMELAVAGVNAAEIRDIYVLGHSLGDADLEYFSFLKKATSGEMSDENAAADAVPKEERDPLEELHHRIQYIIKTYGNDPTITDPVTKEEKDAVRRKFLREQQERDEAITAEFGEMLLGTRKNRRNKAGLIRKKSEKRKEGEVTDSASQGRIRDARWHISYYSDADQERAEHLMKSMGCTDYELFGSIDEAVGRIGVGEIS